MTASPALAFAAKCAFVDATADNNDYRMFVFDEELAALRLQEDKCIYEQTVYIPKAPIERLRTRYNIVRESAKRQVYKKMRATVLRHDVVYGFDS